MAEVTKWSGVAVSMQSALATALTITAITKASPGVVSYTGTDPTNGDYVFLLVEGMYQLNEVVARVANVNSGGNTFELEGIDTTLYTTFSSGTAEVITFGTSISTATTVSNSGGGCNFSDSRTPPALANPEAPGAPGALPYTMAPLWNPSNAGQIAMKVASDAQARRAFKFTFGTGGKIAVFAGYVGFDGAPGGSAQDKVTCQAVITANGRPSYYAS